MMSILAIGVGWATDVTITMSQQGWSNQTSVSSVSSGDVTLNFTDGANATQYYTTGSGVRIYGGGSVTVTAGSNTITAITFTFSGGSYSPSQDGYTVSPGSLTPGVTSTWSGSTKTGVTLTRNTGSGHWRLQAVTVTYTAGQTEPDPTTPSGTITFTPAAGEVTSGTTVAMSFSGTCDGIKYTTDGTSPSATNGTVYNASNPPAITGETTITAAAYNYSNSKYAFGTEATAEYTVTIPSVNYDGSATFDATIDKGTSPLFKNPVTFSCTNGVLDNGSEYRLYKNSTTTFSVPEGSNNKIVKIEFTGVSGNPVSGFGTTIGLVTSGNDGVWTGESESVSFTASVAQVRCSKIQVYYTGTVVETADYYLIGSFNEWAEQDENYKFTARADGSYILNNKTLPDDVFFKILKVEDNNVTYLGGSASDYFGISKDVCTGIQLVDGANFYMEAGGICTFTVSADQKLSVSKEAQLFLAGTINSWGKTDALELTNDGWTIEKELSVDDEFKFVDEWGSWYGGGNTIAEVNLGATIALNTGGNFKMGVDGNFVINVAANKSSFVITRKAETSTAMFDFDNDYKTLFPDLPGTSSGSGDDYVSDGDIIENVTAVVNDITLTVSPNPDADLSVQNKPNNRIWSSSPRLRMYGGTITITAPEGYNLTGIEISQGKWNDNNSSNEGSLSSTSWTGETHTLVISIAGNTQLKSMNVTIAKANSNAPAAPVIEGLTPFVGSTEVSITCATDGASIHYTTDGTDPTIESTLYQSPFTINQGVTVKARAYSQGGVASTITSKEFVKIPELANLDAFYDYYDSDEFAFTGNLVAIAQTGKYLYAQDNARGVLIYGDIDKTYQKGNKIPAPFYAKKGSFGDAPQMTNPREMQAATESVTLEPIEITIAQASHENNLYRYAVIKDVTIADEKIVVGNEELELFNRFNIQIDPVEGQLYNVIGVVGWFNGAQFLPLEIVEVNHTYTVAGEPAALFGSDDAWDINNENGLMTLEDGVYTWTSQPTHLEGDVMFKIVTDKNWNNPSYPADNYIISNVKPGTYTLTVTLDPATGEVNATLNGQVDVYVFGEINGATEFAPDQGVKMNTEDGKTYTATVTVPDTEDGYSFFAFTHKLGDWNTANAYRFLAQSNGNFLVNGATMNVELNMAYNGDNSMKIPAGEYTLTVDMENMKLTITGGTQLSYIIADGVEGVDYTIINDLAVVEKNEPTSELFVSDGNENWIAINAGSNYADLASLKGGFISGAISGKNQNPVFTLSMAPVEGEDVEPVEPATYSLANEFAPKVNEVIIVSKAYYKASENTLRAYAPGGAQGQSLTVDTSFGDFEFVDGQRYTVQGVINIKEPWNTTTGGKGLKGYDYPFQNYTIKVTDVTEESTPTAINGIFLEEGVKSVRFYNAAGIESNVPFNGLNIVVKEMNDGSRVTTKAIIK